MPGHPPVLSGRDAIVVLGCRVLPSGGVAGAAARRADGARKDVLETVTHGARGDVIDAYTTLPWGIVCEEVARLRVKLVEGRVISLAAGRAS